MNKKYILVANVVVLLIYSVLIILDRFWLLEWYIYCCRHNTRQLYAVI